MRLILIVTLFLNFIFSSVSAQSNDDSGNLIYPYNFNITNTALNNGKIPYNSNNINIINRTISGTLGITVTQLYSTYFSDIQTSIALINSNNEIIKVTAGPSFNKNDFITNGVFFPSSQVKNFSIEFDAQLQLNPGYKIALLYKYYFNASVGLPNQTTSGWSPKVTHNRDWFYHNKTFSFIDTYIPPSVTTTITGPSSICSDGTYIITNSGTITLENASGIATLTKINGNSYKVSRVGTSNGTVSLQSTTGTKITKKDIFIGTKIDGYIEGPATMRPGLTYEFKLILNDNIANYSNIEIGQPSGTTLVSKTTTTIKVKVLSNFAFSPGENEHIVTVTANANVGNCGNASISKPVTVFDPRIPIN
ncbi:hypothetical protein ACFX5U_15440 [Sphingobacterium sp. SG20118]|uniref:hypothetical protein n=1 Tax=Sphingobacterium sp. SG20118 TaxID=3367156 RepID=UPI0037DFBFBC